MTNTGVQQLLATAKKDLEAAEQLEYWSRTLRAAHKARAELSRLPAGELREALRSRR